MELKFQKKNFFYLNNWNAFVLFFIKILVKNTKPQQAFKYLTLYELLFQLHQTHVMF